MYSTKTYHLSFSLDIYCLYTPNGFKLIASVVSIVTISSSLIFLVYRSFQFWIRFTHSNETPSKETFPHTKSHIILFIYYYIYM